MEYKQYVQIKEFNTRRSVLFFVLHHTDISTNARLLPITPPTVCLSLRLDREITDIHQHLTHTETLTSNKELTTSA